MRVAGEVTDLLETFDAGAGWEGVATATGFASCRGMHGPSPRVQMRMEANMSIGSGLVITPALIASGATLNLTYQEGVGSTEATMVDAKRTEARFGGG